QMHAQSEADAVVPASVTRRKAALRSQIRQRAWYDEGSGVVTEPVPMAEVQAHLASAAAALVAYIVVDGRLAAPVVTAERADGSPLGELAPVEELLSGMQADLDVTAAALRPPLRATVQQGLLERIRLLSDLLIAPIAHLLGDRRLVLTPTGALAGTPWTMLPPLVGRPLTVPRSASTWAERRGTPLGLASAALVAGPRVNRAEEEVRKVASCWPGASVLAGADAHAAAVTGLASAADVLHVSAHGRHAADNPLFSGLEL